MAELETLETNTIHFGPPNAPVLVIIPVKNRTDEQGAWILTTGRGALKNFTLFEMTETGSEVLLSSEQRKAFRDNLNEYQAISWEVILEGQEERYFGFLFESQNSTYLPLSLQTYTSFFKDRRSNIALVSSVVMGALVLIFLNIIFFGITGKREFLWLGLAEIAFTFNTVHAEGYTSIFLFPNNPGLGSVFGDIVKCAFAISMAQFARSFIRTQINFPRTDMVLRSLIYIGLAVIILQLGTWIYPSGFRMVLFYLSWVIAVLIALYLPFVGLIATRRLGRQYWPLILAWGSLGLYVFYAAIASSGIVKGLPINWHLAGPIGLFEAIMATIALGLHIRKIQLDRIETDAQLTQSLQERLHMSERANRLSNERAMAIATVHDQNTLLHASGHDSQQVIAALKSAIHYIDAKGEVPLNTDVSDILRASAGYLEDIVSTTMSMPIISVDKQAFIAISGFIAEDFLAPLNMIYDRICRDKGLRFSIETDPNIFVVSDRALLMRAVSNYLSNAFKFTETGDVKVSVSCDGQNLKLIISDTGIGIDPNVANELNSLESGRRKGLSQYSGTGSGYLTSKQLVVSLGGTVSILPGEHNGTDVTLLIPFAPKQLSGCDDIYLSKQLKNFELVDIDVGDMNRFGADKSGAVDAVPMTYDDSAKMRHRLSEHAKVMILKPLYAEMIDHPVFKTS